MNEQHHLKYKLSTSHLFMSQNDVGDNYMDESHQGQRGKVPWGT